MRLDDLHLWYLGDPTELRYVGALKLVAAGRGVSLPVGRESHPVPGSTDAPLPHGVSLESTIGQE